MLSVKGFRNKIILKSMQTMFVLFKLILLYFIWKTKRQTDLYLLSYSPKTCSCQDWARLKSGIKTHSISKWASQSQQLNHCLLLPRVYISRSTGLGAQLGIKTRTTAAAYLLHQTPVSCATFWNQLKYRLYCTLLLPCACAKVTFYDPFKTVCI